MNIPILILAAGQSRRMRGVDKLLQDIDGTPLLRRVAETALAATSDAVLVALPAKPHPRWAALAGSKITGVTVSEAAEGMNASLRTGVAALPDDSDAVMILLADLPDITTNDIKTVMQAVQENQDNLIWRGRTKDGKPGHPVVFHRQLFTDLCALRGDAGAQSVVKSHKHQLHMVALPGQNARLDLDTPEAWEKWRKTRQ